MVILDGVEIVTGTGTISDGRIAVDGDTIVTVGTNTAHAGLPEREGEIIHLADHWVLPGFVDIHCHGGGGGSYTAGDAESALRAHEFHRSRGATTSVASMVTTSVEHLSRDIAVMAELVEDGVLAGIHLEGPFISSARCGAHDPALVRDPDLDLLHSLVRAGRGTVRMVTLAPELPGGIDAVRYLTDGGVTAAVGHTDADYATAGEAFDAGASVATHLFNAMRPIHHRDPGPITAAMERDHVTVELINDGLHLHPAIVRGVFRLVGSHRVALITDAISAAGMSDGPVHLGPMRVEVAAGVARLAESGAIAGSTLTLDVALRRAVQDGLSIVDVSTALSGAPARVLGLDDRIGTLEPGKQADLVVLDANLNVAGVMARGRWVAGTVHVTNSMGAYSGRTGSRTPHE